MRLSQKQRQVIRDEVACIFGADARGHVFGSRLDDTQRGGDIDLHIEAAGNAEELLDRELALYARLQRNLGEQRIDIVVHGRGQPLRSIDRHARATGIPV
jgi:predicted nucleotidyltransferase